MSDYLLDTSFLIEYFDEIAAAREGPARLFRSKVPVRTRFYASIVAVAELLEGADDAVVLERELRRVARIVGLHQQHARKAASIQQRARAVGSRLGENDAWIAATAALAGLVIIGDDDQAFSNRAGVGYVNFRATA